MMTNLSSIACLAQVVLGGIIFLHLLLCFGRPKNGFQRELWFHFHFRIFRTFVVSKLQVTLKAKFPSDNLAAEKTLPLGFSILV
jgi:hypothetical protein